MTRRIPTTFLTVALLLAACGGEATRPELTDPTEILTAAAEQAAAAQGVHLNLTAEGSLAIDLTGAGGAPIDLTGSTAAADIDLRGGDARLTFELPSLLGLRGELLSVDGASYLKTTLTGAQYQVMNGLPDLSGGTDGSADPSATPDARAIAAMVTALTDILRRPGVDPAKGADVECGGKTCYTVTIDLTAEELATLMADAGTDGLPLPGGLPIPIPELGDADVALTVLVTKDTNDLASLQAVITFGAADELTLDLTFSKWGTSVTVEAPPADQVKGGG